MKKLLCILLTLVLLLTACAPAVTEDPGIPYTTVSVPIPDFESLDWEALNSMALRYADTKEPIPLSTSYDGKFWATIPAEHAERELELYTPEIPEFSDYDETVWQFWTIQQAVLCGLYPMPEDGMAAPMENSSRREAVEMVLRLIGQPANWETAEKYELFAEIPDFTPDAPITRQELVVLCAKALKLAGLAALPEATREDVAAQYELEDVDEIADWAVNAYAEIANAVPTDFLETGKMDADGLPGYAAYAQPESIMLRHEVTEFVDRLRYERQIYPSQIAIEYGFDKAMPVIDGSTSTYPFTDAVYRNLFHNGYQHPMKPAKHSKSHASYQRLIAGEVDMIFASVYPHKDILQMAEDAGVELELIPIAYDAMVFFTNSENSIDGLTTQQITDIYVSDAYENWKDLGGPDAPFIPYCRNNDSGSHSQMERHFLGDNPIHENIAPETSRSMSDILTDIMDVPYNTPGAYGLGYSIYYYFHNMDAFYGTTSLLKLLEIDGVAPTDETIASGEYPLSNNTYLALRKDTPADHPARKMADFMLTKLGQQCVMEAGFGPLDPSVKQIWQ